MNVAHVPLVKYSTAKGVYRDPDLGFQFEKAANTETTQISETFQYCNAKKKKKKPCNTCTGHN